MDDDLETGFYICGGVGGGAAVAAGGVAIAGVGGTVITTEMIVGAGIFVGKEVADELVDQGVSAATGGVVPGLPTSATDLVQGIGSGGIKKIIKRRPNPGADGGDSVHIIEKINDQTISVTHRVEVNGQVVHQHQTHIGTNGTQRQFPDEWIEYPNIDQ